jgi:hypothetical protein
MRCVDIRGVAMPQRGVSHGTRDKPPSLVGDGWRARGGGAKISGVWQAMRTRLHGGGSNTGWSWWAPSKGAGGRREGFARVEWWEHTHDVQRVMQCGCACTPQPKPPQQVKPAQPCFPIEPQHHKHRPHQSPHAAGIYPHLIPTLLLPHPIGLTRMGMLELRDVAWAGSTMVSSDHAQAWSFVACSGSTGRTGARFHHDSIILWYTRGQCLPLAPDPLQLTHRGLHVQGFGAAAGGQRRGRSVELRRGSRTRSGAKDTVAVQPAGLHARRGRLQAE